MRDHRKTALRRRFEIAVDCGHSSGQPWNIIGTITVRVNGSRAADAIHRLTGTKGISRSRGIDKIK